MKAPSPAGQQIKEFACEHSTDRPRQKDPISCSKEERLIRKDFVGDLLFKYAVAPDIDNPVGTGPDQHANKKKV